MTEEEKQRDKFIYENVLKRYEHELQHTNDLDAKASSIIGFVGILAGIISGFGAFTLKIPTNYPEMAVVALFTTSLIFLFSAFLVGLKAYFPKDYSYVPDPYYLIGKYEKAKQEKIICDLNANCAVAVEENMNTNARKCNNITHAFWLLFAAIVFFSLFAIASAFST